jgi:hypothetical protein
MKAIEVTEWKPGLQVVSLIDLVRNCNCSGLMQAKRDVESFLAGKALVLQAQDAREVLGELEKLGVNTVSAVITER